MHPEVAPFLMLAGAAPFLPLLDEIARAWWLTFAGVACAAALLLAEGASTSPSPQPVDGMLALGAALASGMSMGLPIWCAQQMSCWVAGVFDQIRGQSLSSLYGVSEESTCSVPVARLWFAWVFYSGEGWWRTVGGLSSGSGAPPMLPSLSNGVVRSLETGVESVALLAAGMLVFEAVAGGVGKMAPALTLQVERFAAKSAWGGIVVAALLSRISV